MAEILLWRGLVIRVGREFMQQFCRLAGGTEARNSLAVAALCLCLAALPSAAQVSVRSVKVLGSKNTVEIEVEASDRVLPQAQLLTGPDRLVIDFPNAVPGVQLRNQSVDRGEVKDVRVGLFQSKPPVTRVVLDLKSAQSYQIFPSGRTVMIKINNDPTGGDASAQAGDPGAQPHRPGLVIANFTTRAEPIRVEAPPQPSVQVSYRNGLLGIHANKATLSEVLYAIQQRTGADISIAAGAEQEKVVADIEPGPAAEVLARLLNGSKFNFLILNASNDPTQLERVILTTKPDIVFTPPTPQPTRQAMAERAEKDEESMDDEPAYSRNGPGNGPPPPLPVASKGAVETRPADPNKAADPNKPASDDTTTPDQ